MVHRVRPDPANPPNDTAIDKRATSGRVHVGVLGLAGDRQCDSRHHGGPEQAVYAYAGEDADHWSLELGRAVPPGYFGENLRTRALDVSGAVIGETWQVGQGVVLEVTSPRVPCTTFASWTGEPHWVRRFTAHGALGAYLPVLRTGEVGSGDDVVVLDRPAHGVRVRECFPVITTEHARRLLDSERQGLLRLCPDLRGAADRSAARA